MHYNLCNLHILHKLFDEQVCKLFGELQRAQRNNVSLELLNNSGQEPVWAHFGKIVWELGNISVWEPAWEHFDMTFWELAGTVALVLVLGFVWALVDNFVWEPVDIAVWEHSYNFVLELICIQWNMIAWELDYKPEQEHVWELAPEPESNFIYKIGIFVS